MAEKTDYIAVFDSGLGGISVLRHLRRILPGERFLYFGDSANAPYGVRTHENVAELTVQCIERLLPRGVKAVVVACNTATAAAINPLREKYPDRIIIGIEPALKPAADRFPTGTIAVMATPVTLQEEKFAALLHRYDETCTIYKVPAPGLVPLVEAGKGNSRESEEYLRQLLEPYGHLDALVLGCTHYPFAKKVLRKILGDSVLLLDGGEGTARETQRRLAQAGLLENGPGELILENSSRDPALLWRARQLLESD